MKYDVFISYRRNGGFETARHLYDLLVHDGYDVSFDLDTLREGAFNKQLLTRIDECVDFLIVIDQHAFDRTLDPCFDPQKDWMRIELAYALKKEKNIVPVLLAGARFPENLPEDIQQVIYKNVPEYSLSYFDAFYQKLKSFFHSKPGIPVLFRTDRACFVKDSGRIIAEVSVEGTTTKLTKGEHRLDFVRVDDPGHEYEEILLIKESGSCQVIDISFASHLRKMSAEEAKQSKAFLEIAQKLLEEDEKDRYVYYVKKAAELGNIEAVSTLASLYLAGLGVEEDICEGFRLLKPILLLAKKGNDVAQYCMGMICYQGWNVETGQYCEDGYFEDALKWFRVSSEQGNVDAMHEMGNLYSENGNLEEAVKSYRQAAELGMSHAQFALADCLSSGKGVEEDYSEAVKWFRRAAEQGHAFAQFRLGECFQQGTGVRIDKQEALKWYRKAEENDDEYIRTKVQDRLATLF